MFAEHLANLLLLRYHDKWDEKCKLKINFFLCYNLFLNYLAKDQRVLHILQGFALSEEIANASLAIGLGVDEVVVCFAGLLFRVKIYIDVN